MFPLSKASGFGVGSAGSGDYWYKKNPVSVPDT